MRALPRIGTGGRGLAGLAVMAGVGLCAAGAAKAGPAELLAHRAVYEVELAAVRGAGRISRVDGVMEFKWNDVCDGWAIDYRARLHIVFAERGAASRSWKYSAWESDDGRRFRYFLQRFRDGEESAHHRGRARLDPDGGGTAHIAEPREHSLALPRDTLFPKAHTQAVLSAARARERFLFRHVFDGTGDADGLSAVNTVLLGPSDDAPPQAAAARLAGRRAWNVQMAFFPPESPDSTPASEQQLRLYENGVVGDMRIDYGEFAVRADLSEFQVLDKPDCG